MGCGNPVRTEAWRRVGGYDKDFFLYRNDCDLALKLLAAGLDVRFNPAWIVWHDSPAAARKSDRWLHLATRNWVWLARRHGRGRPAVLGALAGVVWASRQAGFNPLRQWRVLQGATAGLFSSAEPLPPGIEPNGAPYAEMIQLQFRSKLRSETRP